MKLVERNGHLYAHGFVKDTTGLSQAESSESQAPRIPPASTPGTEPLLSSPVPPAPPAQSEREITMEDVRGYLVRAKAAKAEHRRNTWISSLF